MPWGKFDARWSSSVGMMLLMEKAPQVKLNGRACCCGAGFSGRSLPHEDQVNINSAVILQLTLGTRRTHCELKASSKRMG